MALKNFKELTDKIRGGDKRKVVLAVAQDAHALEAVIHASEQGIVDYILVGIGEEIKKIALEHDLKIDENCIVEAKTDEEAAAVAVSLVRDGKGDFLMKGKLMTATLLKAVVNSETGIRTENIMSHVAVLEIPNYHKLVCITDGGMIPHPTLEQKIKIVENGILLMKSLACDVPKVAILAGVEVENPKMPETTEAIEIAKFFTDRDDCIVQGPLSLDLSINAAAAEIKGFSGGAVADADVLLVPNLASGNMMSKAITFCGGTMAGLIVGAKAPIVLTSRGASTESKFLSLAMAAASCKT